MATLERILVPVDFSPCSRHAAAYAAKIAQGVGASLTLLHVWEGPRVNADLAEWWESLHDDERAAKSLASFVTAQQQGPLNELAVFVRRLGVPQVSTELLEGRPASVVLDRASSYDLVVMGTHGRTGIMSFLVGSVTERVSRHCPVPILLVPDETASSSRSGIQPGPQGSAQG